MLQDKTCKVSVCIPTYNTAKYLGQAIKSALAQEFKDFELVICDNASTDDTPALCKRFSDPRIRYVRYEQLLGQGGNWNRCVDLSQGQYVVLLHADDLLLPTFLSRAVAMMEANPEVGLVHCTAKHFDDSRNIISVQRRYDSDRVESGEMLLRELLLKGCVVCAAGVMVRRSVYKDVGYFTERVRWGIDQHMWARIALRHKTAYIAEPLALYRQHAQSGTSEVLATGSNGLDDLWVTKDIFSRIPEERKDLHALKRQAIYQVAHRAWCMAEAMCCLGFKKASRKGIYRAMQIYPPIILKPQVLALWFASYFDYKWFTYIKSLKRKTIKKMIRLNDKRL